MTRRRVTVICVLFALLLAAWGASEWLLSQYEQLREPARRLRENPPAPAAGFSAPPSTPPAGKD